MFQDQEHWWTGLGFYFDLVPCDLHERSVVEPNRLKDRKLTINCVNCCCWTRANNPWRQIIEKIILNFSFINFLFVILSVKEDHQGNGGRPHTPDDAPSIPVQPFRPHLTEGYSRWYILFAELVTIHNDTSRDLFTSDSTATSGIFFPILFIL